MKPTEKSFKAGEYLFRENDKSRELYIIQSGKVKVFRTVNNREIEIAVLGKGAVLGEMALIDGRPRSASAKAIEPSTATRVDVETFETKTRGVPSWFLTIIRIVSTKIRNAHKHLERIQLDQRGVNIILMLQYYLHRAAAAAQNEKKYRLELNIYKNHLPRLVATSQQRLVYVLDFLQSNGFITLSDDIIECADMERFDDYCAFLRCFVRKQCEKLVPVRTPLKEIIKEMQRTLKVREGEDRKPTMSADEFHVVFAASGCTESEESIIDEMERMEILNAKKTAGKESDAAPAVITVNGPQFYLYMLQCTFDNLVPKP